MQRRLGSGLAVLDALIDGGIVRGRISEIIDQVLPAPVGLNAFHT